MQRCICLIVSEASASAPSMISWPVESNWLWMAEWRSTTLYIHVALIHRRRCSGAKECTCCYRLHRQILSNKKQQAVKRVKNTDTCTSEEAAADKSNDETSNPERLVSRQHDVSRQCDFSHQCDVNRQCDVSLQCDVSHQCDVSRQCDFGQQCSVA